MNDTDHNWLFFSEKVKQDSLSCIIYKNTFHMIQKFKCFTFKFGHSGQKSVQKNQENMYTNLGMKIPYWHDMKHKAFKKTFLLHKNFHISKTLNVKGPPPPEKKNLEKTVLFDNRLMPLRNGSSKCIKKKSTEQKTKTMNIHRKFTKKSKGQ